VQWSACCKSAINGHSLPQKKTSSKGGCYFRGNRESLEGTSPFISDSGRVKCQIETRSERESKISML